MRRHPTIKRQQIVTATLQRFRTSGIGKTTLKDVAEASGVPLGNLYYYFKTREELILAALDACEEELDQLMTQWSALTASDWMRAYFSWLLEDPAAATTFGCPFGALALELRTLGDPAAARAAAIVQRYFQAFSHHAQAMHLSEAEAEELFMAVQGTYVVARIQDDAVQFEGSIKRIQEQLWKDAERQT